MTEGGRETVHVGDNVRVPDNEGAAARPLADTPLARFLVGTVAEPPTLEVTRRATLSGVVLVRAPDHPDHDELRLDAFRTAARHLAVKAELGRLFRAWNDAGIVPLVMKGFYLSEFVYTSNALRVYNDIDLYLPPERVATACDTARALGWDVVWRWGEEDNPRAWRASGYHGHEIAHLLHPELRIGIDVHRRLVHNAHEQVPRFRIQARLTEAIVRATQEVDWCGASVKQPSPVDAVVFGLALNRCWSRDLWAVKPRDYCDLDALRVRHALSRATILQRAHELGVRRTVEIYLRRCDPYRRRLLLKRPRWQPFWWNLAIMTERGPHDLVWRFTRIRLAIARTIDGVRMLARVWPLAAQAVRFVRDQSPVEDWRARYQVAARRRHVGLRTWRTFVTAVHRHLVFRRLDPDARHAIAALIGYAWLRDRGYEADLKVDGAVPSQVTLCLHEAPLDATPQRHDHEW